MKHEIVAVPIHKELQIGDLIKFTGKYRNGEYTILESLPMNDIEDYEPQMLVIVSEDDILERTFAINKSRDMVYPVPYNANVNKGWDMILATYPCSSINKIIPLSVVKDWIESPTNTIDVFMIHEGGINTLHVVSPIVKPNNEIECVLPKRGVRPSDILEAAHRYERGKYNILNYVDLNAQSYESTIIDTFIAGANWYKTQLTKIKK